MGKSYFEDTPEKLRPQKMSEYLRDLGVLDSEILRNFASQNNVTIENFVEAVDKSYSLGQRYGQAIRICENFVHRQDYTLAGEMCDDSYYCLVDRLEYDKKSEKWDQGKYEAIKKDKEKSQLLHQKVMKNCNICIF